MLIYVVPFTNHLISHRFNTLAEIATHTTTGKHITLATTLPEALDAICSVLPLDYFEEYQARIMSPSPGLTKPPAGIEVEAACKEVIAKHSGINANIGSLERYAFYEEAKNCFAVVHTLERRPYGNVILVKGVIGPDGNDLRPS
jgi:L-fucose mutarotase